MKPGYQKPDPGWYGDRKRGAGMGRPSDLPLETEDVLTLRHVPLDSGGYDPGGAYWGTPGDLYLVSDDDGRERYLRGTPETVKAEFPNASWTSPKAITPEDIADMLGGYIEAALWSTLDSRNGDNDDTCLDANFCETDLSPETHAKLKADCERFARENEATLLRVVGTTSKRGWAYVGHDLWLTANGHGCGFWDGDWPKVEGDLLTEGAKRIGERYLYVVGPEGEERIHS